MRQAAQFLLTIVRGTIRAYPQVFFSDKLFFGILLIAVSFVDVIAGLSGLAVALSANLAAMSAGLNTKKVDSGLYAFNAVLAGLGIGIMFEPSAALFITLVFSGLLCLAVTVMFEGITSRYTLPFLSIPFLITVWVVILASRGFTELELSERGIYYLNYLYKAGGQELVDFYQTSQNLSLPQPLYSFVTSLGAIFFQPSVVAGLVVAGGLLLSSRIAFISSLLGFFSAWFFFRITGSDIETLSQTHIGFNFILTAIALGSFFVVPSWKSMLLVVVVTPVNVIFAQAMAELFEPWQLPIYSLPFNFIVLTFLYLLKYRIRFMDKLPEVVVQEYSPEKNLYSYNNYLKRFGTSSQMFPLRLPFWGEWSVEQGHSGKITHTDEYRYAWDFSIRDNENKTFKSPGTSPEDFYCYKKAVLSPGYGKVVKIIDGIPDNEIGKPDVVNNWGNCIVIKHSDFLYSKLCHLLAGSFKIFEGDFVVPGQLIGLTGNSGRSPEPHLHMQLQATPWIGSPTLKYPIAHFISRKESDFSFHNYEFPVEDCRVSNPEPNRLLSKVLDFIPGQKMAFEINDGQETWNELWTVFTDAANKTYIHCDAKKSTAWFTNDKIMHYFQHFKGNRKTLLYHFYLAFYKVQTGFYRNITITDDVNLPQVFRPYQLFLNDFVAPFRSLLSAKYNLSYHEIDDELSPASITLKSNVRLYFLKICLKQYHFSISIDNDTITELVIEKGNKKWTAKQIG